MQYQESLKFSVSNKWPLVDLTKPCSVNFGSTQWVSRRLEIIDQRYEQLGLVLSFGVRSNCDHSQKENVDEDILVMGKGVNKVEIDLMQPIDPEKAPKVHIPALNHIGLWIDDLDAAVETLTAQGIKFTPGGIRKGAGTV